MKTRALISYKSILTDKDLREDHLKLCFLWYDEILYETLGNFDERSFLSGLVGDLPKKEIRDITDIFLPLSKRLDKSVTGTVLDRLPAGYPRWGDNYEHYDYPDPENALEFAHNAILRKIEAEKGVGHFDDGYEIEQVEGRARVAVDTVALWQRVNQELSCMLQATDDEKAAIDAVQGFKAQSPPISGAEELFCALIPSLRQVSWSEVVEYKRRGSFSDLRKKIDEAYSLGGSNISESRKIFSGFEDSATQEIIDKFRPKVKRIAIEAVLANIPGIPGVNPFSIFFGARDTVKEFQKKKNLDWFYLLRDIRSAGDNVE